MEKTYDFYIEWDELSVGDGCVYASGPVKSTGVRGGFGYLPEDFPELGRYNTASFDMQMVLSEEPRNVMQSVDKDESTREFECRYTEASKDGYNFYEMDSETYAGGLRANLDDHPD